MYLCRDFFPFNIFSSWGRDHKPVRTEVNVRVTNHGILRRSVASSPPIASTAAATVLGRASERRRVPVSVPTGAPAPGLPC